MNKKKEKKKSSFQKEGQNCFVLSSKFSILFPQYQEKNLRESWNIVSRIVRPYGVGVKIDLSSGKMEVKVTKKTKDPFVIFKVRDFLKLLARSVPVQQACKILEDDIFCDIVNISYLRLSKEQFLRRRKRLIGYKGLTIRAIEIVTQCYLLVQGNTVSCMGKHSGLKAARKIIQTAMSNVHPISLIKMLWFQKSLRRNPDFTSFCWLKFLPSIKTNLKNNSRPFFASLENLKKKPENKINKGQQNIFYEKRLSINKNEKKYYKKKKIKFISSFDF
mmetsp:Transcript_35428/g.70895  ORF Transcript_35428/g.70895 Transcript_35428/m.70895 type:complete len:275 (-) Transcript_35428:3173-3997(-)